MGRISGKRDTPDSDFGFSPLSDPGKRQYSSHRALITVLQKYGGPGEGDTLVTCDTIVQSYLLLITMPMGGITLGMSTRSKHLLRKRRPGPDQKGNQCITGLCVIFCIFMTIVTKTISPLYVRHVYTDS